MFNECEIAKFYTWTEPVAKKKHRCCECLAPIEVGEKHFHGRGKWAGDVTSYRQHLVCMEACMVLRDEFQDGECIVFGSLKEEFDEMRCDNWYPERDRWKEPCKRLRSLMARILWRERKHRRRKPA